jgi:hypothetical protein
MPKQVRRTLLAGAVILCALACSPARALASSTLETTLMDDQALIYSSPGVVQQTLQQAAAIGIDRIKVSMVWYIVAPDPTSTGRPGFNAADPNSYPQGAWDRYDQIVRLAQQLGLKIYFQIDPPAPRWAIPPGEPLQDQRVGWAPSANEFEQFVEAVGRRYSGTFRPPSESQGGGGNQSCFLGFCSGGGSSPPPPPGSPLPRVSYWSIWNEPNLPGWLNPWYDGSELLEPPIYRALLNAAWDGLASTGHSTATDTFLVGEVANSGQQPPIPFMRALYCVDARDRYLTGSAASHFGCPSGSRADFVRSNPALFGASGVAHHPYGFNDPPDRPYPLKGWITMFNLDKLERVINGIFASYGRLPRGGVPMYLTEYGYESNPPNPFVRNSAVQQAVWLNEAEYMAWRDPYVRSLNQFELADSAPNRAQQAGSYAYWAASFQTGLEFEDGQPKPSFFAFRIPIWVPRAHRHHVVIWGQLRPANHSQVQYAVIQYARRGAPAFRQLRVVPTVNPEGFVFTRVTIPAPGVIRIAWLDSATGTVDYSRYVSVR